MIRRQQLQEGGIEIHGLKGFFCPEGIMDADTGIPTAITSANVAVPVEMLTYFSPRAIQALTAPRNATKLFAEVVQGDWTTERLKYRLAEYVGNVAPYGDFSENGMSDVNNEWIATDTYRFQTMIQYGDLETAKNAQAKVALVADKQSSAANTVSLYSNRFYMYGVKELQCYGIVNHPSLASALTPISVGGVTDWATKSANDIFNDIEKIVDDVIDKSQGLIDVNMKGKIGLAPKLVGYLSRTNTFGLSVRDMITKNYPGLEIVSVPEFATSAGNLVYVFPDEVNGQKVGECLTSMKFRTFQVIPQSSSFKQKAAAATCGFRFYMPFALSRMLVSQFYVRER